MFNFETTAGTARGYLARPAGGSGPGVLVLHAWWGLTEVFTQTCDRLAADGFVAFAPDLYASHTAATIPEAEALMQTRDNAQMEATARAAVGVLGATLGVTGPGLGAMGFSMGSQWMGHLTPWYPEALKAAVMFYGALEADYTVARAAYLGHFAENDPYEEREYIDPMAPAMRAAGRTVTMHFYPGTGHWFFEANRPEAYHAEAAALAWTRTIAFLRAQLAGGKA